MTDLKTVLPKTTHCLHITLSKSFINFLLVSQISRFPSISSICVNSIILHHLRTQIDQELIISDHEVQSYWYYLCAFILLQHCLLSWLILANCLWRAPPSLWITLVHSNKPPGTVSTILYIFIGKHSGAAMSCDIRPAHVRSGLKSRFQDETIAVIFATWYQ